MTTIQIEVKKRTTIDEGTRNKLEQALTESGVEVEQITVEQNKVRYGEEPPAGYISKNQDTWTELPEDYTSSTISYFESGYKHTTKPVEIKIWRLPSTVYGITKDGEVVTDWDMDEKYDLVYIGEGYELSHEPIEILAREIPYVVELANSNTDTVVESHRSKNPEKTAKELKQAYENGEYSIGI